MIRPASWISAVFFACCACSAESPPTGAGGAGGTPAGSSGGAGGMAGQGTSGSGVVPQGGVSGGGAGNAGTPATSAGAGGAGGSAGSGGGSAGAGGQGGPTVPEGCAADPHPICIDFESGIDEATWTGGTDGAISTQDKAHGTSSYHAYKNAGVLTTTKFGVIKDVMWGRFYLRMTPGAPGGHGNIVGAYQGSDWYELGWQFNGLMGVWHWASGENPLRSTPVITDQWYCVELLFDGTKTEMPKWWVDGQEVEYYMGEPNNQKPHVITQWDKLTVGFTTYAGLGLNKEPYGNNDPPVLTDMWLDDIAFDVKRIGCIGAPKPP